MRQTSQTQLIGTILIIVGLLIVLILGSPLLFNLAMIVLGLYMLDKGLRLCRMPGLLHYVHLFLTQL
jgi:uncharacterized membrane protein